MTESVGGFWLLVLSLALVLTGVGLPACAAVSSLAERMCWQQVAKVVNTDMGIGVAVWQKPTTNECYDDRHPATLPPMCPPADNPDAAW